jgi:hypothetical protein
MSAQTDKITVSKLTVKIDADPTLVAAEESGRLWLCDIFGRAVGLKQGEDKRTSNIWTALTGKFEAFFPTTGKTYQAGKLFLPNGIQDVVEAAVGVMPKDDPMASVDFAFRIFAVRATNAVKYSYQAQPLIDMDTNDGLADIRAAVEDRRKRELKAGVRPGLLNGGPVIDVVPGLTMETDISTLPSSPFPPPVASQKPEAAKGRQQPRQAI